MPLTPSLDLTPLSDSKEDTAALRRAVEEFDSNSFVARRDITRLLRDGSPEVIREAVTIVRTGRRTAAYRCVLDVLVEDGRLLDAICDRDLLSVEEAAEVIQTATRCEPRLDVRLLETLLARPASAGNAAVEQATRELLAAYDLSGLGGRLMPLFVQLLRQQNPEIRSKIALIAGRGTNQITWALTDPDPRVRANGLESLWGVNTGAARAVFWKAAHDRNPRVAGNALLGLLLTGDRGAEAEVRRLARHSSAHFRATMAWVMGQSKSGIFLEALNELLGDPAINVRRGAARALNVIKQASAAAVNDCESGAENSEMSLR
jgi:hypothetical protein